MKAIDWINGISCEKRSFMDGVPIVGTQARVIRSAKRLLEQREGDDVENMWIKHELEVSFVNNREEVFSIAKTYMDWPNTLFIPNDRAAIVFGFIPGVWIDPMDILSDIANLYQIEWIDPTDLLVNIKKRSAATKDKSIGIYESALNDTLIDFFKYLGLPEKLPTY